MASKHINKKLSYLALFYSKTFVCKAEERTSKIGSKRNMSPKTPGKEHKHVFCPGLFLACPPAPLTSVWQSPLPSPTRWITKESKSQTYRASFHVCPFRVNSVAGDSAAHNTHGPESLPSCLPVAFPRGVGINSGCSTSSVLTLEVNLLRRLAI